MRLEPTGIASKTSFSPFDLLFFFFIHRWSSRKSINSRYSGNWAGGISAFSRPASTRCEVIKINNSRNARSVFVTWWSHVLRRGQFKAVKKSFAAYRALRIVKVVRRGDAFAECKSSKRKSLNRKTLYEESIKSNSTIWYCKRGQFFFSTARTLLFFFSTQNYIILFG